jgi:phosphate uptake regulator
MIRKLVKHGPSTLIVSVPAPWVKRMGLRAGDEVWVSEEQNKILISTDKNRRKDSIELNITNLDRTSVVLLLHALYRNGFCNITLLFDKPETIHFRTQQKVPYSKIIHFMVKRLVGFEVSKESSKRIELSQISYIDRDEIQNMINRTFTLLQDMVTSFCKALRENDLHEIKKIEDKHDSITRLVSFLIRAISRGEYENKSASVAMPHVLANIDKIIDILKYMARDKIRDRTPINKKILDLLPVFDTSFVNYAKVFRKYDEQLVRNISQKRDEFKHKVMEIQRDLNEHEVVLTTSLRQALEILYDLVEWRMHLWIMTLPE